MSEAERERLAELLVTAAGYLSVFDEPQRRSDQLPDETDRNRPNWPFQEAATRYVGEYRDVRYWIGAREDEPADEYTQVCLIGITVGGEWRGTTCSDPLDVPYERPSRWPLERTDPEDSTRLVLVPDDYELTDEQAGTWEQVAPNLYHDTDGT